MSARTSITKALVEKFKTITTANGYNTEVQENRVYDKLVFWDEQNDFPALCIVAGTETREYLPAGFKWGYISFSIKLYVKSEEPATDLENLLEDAERVLALNETLTYDTSTPGAQTTEILITSIITDEGLLAPYGIGEITINVRYPVLN